jgi:uncharacterized membrane protein (DUF2068 family)
VADCGKTKTPLVAGLRAVAVLELSKGVLVALLGFGLISLSHHGRDLGEIAQNLLYALHISPVRHVSRAFLAAATRLNDLNLMAVAAGAAVYSIMRFAEGYGLWKGRVWAQWVALVSGMVYLPLEVREVLRRPTPVRLAVFLVNVAIVLYMAYMRIPSKSAPTASKTSA